MGEDEDHSGSNARAALAWWGLVRRLQQLLGVVLARLAGLQAAHEALGAAYARLQAAHEAVVAAHAALAQEYAALRADPTRGEDAAWRNRLEESLAEVARLQTERQRLRDEVARLKGEQGKPQVLPNKRHSSEAERREPRGERRRRGPRGPLRIDRTETRQVEEPLPPDAEYKGHSEVVLQDVRLEMENICFRLEKYYAPSTGKTYQARLPAGYAGDFGPGVHSLVLYLAYETHTSQAKIHTLLTSLGLQIARATVARLCLLPPCLAAEEAAIRQVGLASSPYQHLDDTATRVNGVTQHCHVLSAPLYVSYTTTPGKDRQAVLDVLRLRAARTYQFNAAAWAFLNTGPPLPVHVYTTLATLPHGVDLDGATLSGLLDQRLPKLGPQQRARLLDAAAIGSYRVQQEVPVLDTLIADAAPQFAGVTPDLQVCWIHEGRHYKKLSPHLGLHQALLEAVLEAFWQYYQELQAYRAAPTAAEAARLRAAFDALFTSRTGYAALDACLDHTHQRRASLLRVLDKPYLPLHNNPAELAVRQRVRKRDVSFGARSTAGIQAWDGMQTIIGTATKLGVNVLHYLHDRVSGRYQLPALADLIRERSSARSAAPTAPRTTAAA